MKGFIIALYLFSFVATASILPQTNLRIPVSFKNAKLTEKRFNDLIDQVVESYRPTFKKYGMRQLIVNRKWKDGKINASAGKRGSTFLMNIYGGLGRYESITDDGFLLVLCHEVGHLIGGAPTYRPYNNVSSEGQADYFATHKCFRKIAKQYPALISNNADVHPVAREMCQKQFESEQERQVCLRSSLAQTSLAETFALLSESSSVPQFDTPDPKRRMFILFNGYPGIQCRLDTMFSASLCQKDENLLLSFDSYNENLCSTANGDGIGIRPHCWYVPRED